MSHKEAQLLRARPRKHTRAHLKGWDYRLVCNRIYSKSLRSYLLITPLRTQMNLPNKLKKKKETEKRKSKEEGRMDKEKEKERERKSRERKRNKKKKKQNVSWTHTASYKRAARGNDCLSREKYRALGCKSYVYRNVNNKYAIKRKGVELVRARQGIAALRWGISEMRNSALSLFSGRSSPSTRCGETRRGNGEHANPGREKRKRERGREKGRKEFTSGLVKQVS